MINSIETIHQAIKTHAIDTNLISDGYHTFGELYEHRIVLFIALAKELLKRKAKKIPVWKSRQHDDGAEWAGWFIVGIGEAEGAQMTYHLPTSKWDECAFIPERERAPKWDGHTPSDVLERLKRL
jgi:hypothetical protein